jgi:hypothetical protein
LSSELFTFVVGKNKKPIVVHSGAVTRHSEVLNALINGGMAEAQTQSATLEDIEEEDFVRFCQFAYTGDYSTPPFKVEEAVMGNGDAPDIGFGTSPRPRSTPRKCSPEPVHKVSGPDRGNPPSWTSSTKVKKSYKQKNSKQFWADTPTSKWDSWGIDLFGETSHKPTSLWGAFEDKTFCKELPRQAFLDSCEPVSNDDESQNFTPVFLAHARLYVFADRYLIKPLRQLVLHKLQQTLVVFELYPERIGDILELVRYTYSDNNTSSDGVDELRGLVAVYVAANLDKMKRSDCFVDLLEEGGGFVRNFWRLIVGSIDVGKHGF